MHCTGVRITAGMVSVFREPHLRLGVVASDVMEHFYRAMRTPQHPMLSDLITSGGNSYADLKLTIRTFQGGGNIDITPGALLVDIRDVNQATAYSRIAKEHFQLCEEVTQVALKGVEIVERFMRASLWLACDGGRPAMEAFLAEKGNAALKLDKPPYNDLRKDFTLQFSGLDATKATKLTLAMQPSAAGGDLFVQFEYTQYGKPVVVKSPTEQFEEAETELMALMLHVGLELQRDNAGKP